MGIAGLWRLIREKGFAPEVQHSLPRNLSTTSAKVRVDVNACYFSVIQQMYTKYYDDLDRAHAALQHHLDRLGDKNYIVFYIDGHPAKEKSSTHIQRQQLRTRALGQVADTLATLEARIDNKLRIRNSHFGKLNKFLKSSFHWRYEHRERFQQYMLNKGYAIILCSTEADVAIASDCHPSDLVMSSDSDLLIYPTIRTLWRPIARQSKFLVYEKNGLLSTLDLSQPQLTVFGIVSNNDYDQNIHNIGVKTNYSLVKSLEDGDIDDMVREYLGLEQVRSQNNSGLSFSNSIKVFHSMRQDPAEQSIQASVPQVTLSCLNQRLAVFRARFTQVRREEYEARVAKRRNSNGISEIRPTPSRNRYRTIEQPQDCPRYSFKERYESTKKHDPPQVLRQYTWKEYRSSSDPPESPDTTVATSANKKKVSTIQPKLPEHSDKCKILKAMGWEHPTVTLDVGTLRANVKRALGDTASASTVIGCIQEAARQASMTKRRCQDLLGRYLAQVFSSNVVDKDDRVFLDHMCPRLSAHDADEHNTDNGEDEDGAPSGKQQNFLCCLMTYLYSGNPPGRSGVGPIVARFIDRLQGMTLLPKPDIHKRGEPKNVMPFAPSLLVRSVSTQLATELKQHYKCGSQALGEKVRLLIAKGFVLLGYNTEPRDDLPAIEIFVCLNRNAGHKWSLIPLSPAENGFMTFSEYELAAFFYKRDELHNELRKFIGQDPENTNPLRQAHIVNDYLPTVQPGLLIRQLMCAVAPEGLTSRQRGKAGCAAAVKLPTLQEMRSHINQLRDRRFDPRTYDEKGYVLRGSIRTDGFRLQVLAYKMRELQSVRYRRFSPEVLPDPLVSTTGGTGQFLTEVRNVIKTNEDVERLLGCTAEEAAGQVTYLGIDLGQSCVVGACALMPGDKQPKSKWKRKKKRGKRVGKRKRGKRGGKRKRGAKKRHNDTSMPEVVQLERNERVKGGRTRFINLAVKQKAVSQPTLKHRRWMENRKASTNVEIQSPINMQVSQEARIMTLADIESAAPAVHGVGADLVSHLDYKNNYQGDMDRFYNGDDFLFKRHKWEARRAREQEYRRMADSLLRMVGGCLGARRDPNTKVIIGIGNAGFKSNSGLSSLHSTFEGYFIHMARALNYLVVGVNEYYTSKKCPTCKNFVAQTESIRRLYCPNCQKYMHRDVMAGHNICRVLQGHVERQERPNDLQPVDAAGHFPWKYEEASETPKQGKRQTRSRKRQAWTANEGEGESEERRVKKLQVAD